MNKKIVLITLIFLTTVFLTACTNKENEMITDSSGQESRESINKQSADNENSEDNLNFALTKIAGYSGYTDEMGEIRLRKNADDIYQDQEAYGFLYRDPNKQADFDGVISNIKSMMNSYGYKVTETKPKNTSSDVVTFLKLEKDSVSCIVEYRKITSNEIPELAVGCWE